MKKFLLLYSLFFLPFICHVQEKLPEELGGLWENGNSLLYLGESEENLSPAFSLKLYYGRYYDKTASGEAEKEKPIKKNAAEARRPESFNISFSKEEEVGGKAAGFYLATVEVGGIKSFLPLAILEDKLYFRFYILETNPQGYPLLYRINDTAFLINGRVNKKDLDCYLLTSTNIYKVRYFLTNTLTSIDKEAIDKKAIITFKKEGKEYQINKYLTSGGQTYAGARGRRKEARNVESLAIDSEGLCKSLGIDGNKYNLQGRKEAAVPAIIPIEEGAFYRVSRGEISEFYERIKAENSKPPPPLPPVFKD